MSPRIKKWLQALGFLLIIYATIPLGRPIADFLKERIPFNQFVNIAYVLAVANAFIFLLCKFRIKKVSTYFLLSILIGIYMYFAGYMRIPIEKIHFLEYGFLAFLIFRALKVDMPNVLAYILTFVIAGALGWMEEGLQALTPGRYYDPRDILFNIIGSFMGILVTCCVNREMKSST